MERPRVLSVGQCGMDHGSISGYLSREFHADVNRAHTFDEAVSELRITEYDLILVNRICDYDGSPGVELIRLLRADEALSSIPVMLISNYTDAQAEAVALGAVPGFGKSELLSSKSYDAIQAALRSKSSARQ